jgi:hypothetical protein
MEEPARGRRRYGDEEVGLILKRAAELQGQEPTAAAEGGGLSLTELEEIAAEAGIDPSYLRRAADEVDTVAMPLRGEGMDRIAGAPLTLEFERTLTGELPEDGLEVLIPEIQSAGLGQPSLLGHTLTLQSTTATNIRTLQVTISSQSGRTRIRIEERLDQLAWALVGGITGGVGGGVGLGVGLGVGIGALQSALFAVAWPVGVITPSARTR